MVTDVCPLPTCAHQVGGSTGFDVGVGCDLAATIGSGKHQQTLDFTSDISIGVQGLSFEAAMTDAWKDPFGLKGVTVEKTEIMLSISFAGVPDAFGFSGGLVIGALPLASPAATTATPTMRCGADLMRCRVQAPSLALRPCTSTQLARPRLCWVAA